MRECLYKLQLCGYKNAEFSKTAKKRTVGRVVWTRRAKRTYAAAAALTVLGLGLPLLCRWRTVAFANTILSPLERAIQRKWLRRAVKKLNCPEFAKLIKIGITGSFGKTGCKNILAAILSAQFRVAASRDSFNTPMGFARTVNEDLTPDTEILIMEMGARHCGDIAEMCRLVKPDYGIITAVGEQHLETFGSLENIRAAKMELCDFVPRENIVTGVTCGAPPLEVLHGTPQTPASRGREQGAVVNTSKRAPTAPPVSPVPPVSPAPPAPLYQTKLLGRHNQKNIDLCVQMARKIGITEENIVAAVAGLKPTPHRLELIEAQNGVRILDDSYNANPDGAKVALEVLAAFGGTKVVQTCGFAEQGEKAVTLNREFGVQIAAAADFVIITGGLNKAALAEGLTAADFPPEKTYFVPNTEAAKTIYPRVLHGGDTLLIENDLPENY
jgi:UDP-N-acetylmuramoyl-tripeptide--D-alanyl-D-alanine ligase